MSHAFRGVHIETLRDPSLYSQRQIDEFCLVAAEFNYLLRAQPGPARGKLVVCAEPDEAKA